MKVEDYFAMFNINSDEDQKRRFLETLAEKARRWASMIDIDKLKSYRYDGKRSQRRKREDLQMAFHKKDLPKKEGRHTLLLKLGRI